MGFVVCGLGVEGVGFGFRDYPLERQARPVHSVITMTKWIRTSRLSIKNSLSVGITLSRGRFGDRIAHDQLNRAFCKVAGRIDFTDVLEPHVRRCAGAICCKVTPSTADCLRHPRGNVHLGIKDWDLGFRIEDSRLRVQG